MKINWKNVAQLSIIGAVIIFISFASWYYFAIKLPQEKIYQENIEQNLKIIENIKKLNSNNQ